MEIASIAPCSQLDAEKWRRLNNRIKHVDKVPANITEYVDGMEKLPEILPMIRLSANIIIQTRLHRL